ncbi:hypothetical protein SAMN05216403_11344 [Nitrosospira multiformis ATCC 25196]|uniref:Uncharacterized protein n=1 Tax=Nitrosospira multiformis (strain ATCC 25196 / NCIMB 11849 / C 71) TaxID=323848 RepID=Q2Y9P5_NITMU|nr:hypothetical protein [Nitrosospira multiformis]ABB74526.1 hypothetical protein Nmul_A1223 [Nitrosospira multiformis ATCC 25196]SEF88927.1 hypothetical protein SAMN05216403_11344 [Nitrosospira multiformis ATCC 25196]
MPNSNQSRRLEPNQHGTLRLTFRVADGAVHLVSYERLPMICPPSVGEAPQARKNGGFWMELRDGNNHVLFHRLIHSPLIGSVEVHSPDGKIERKFGEVKESIFEVLLPDNPAAESIALIGESLDLSALSAAGAQQRATSTELARFDIPRGEKGDMQ